MLLLPVPTGDITCCLHFPLPEDECQESVRVAQSRCPPRLWRPPEHVLVEEKSRVFHVVDFRASVQQSDKDLGACEAEIRCTHARTSTLY